MRRSALGLAIVLAGCGSSSAPAGSQVRLTVYQYSAPAPGVTVWWSDPATGQPLGQGTTDRAGVLTAEMPAGAAVTAAELEAGKDPPSWQLYTVLATQPGDDLWVGDRQAGQSTQLGSLSVTLPGPAPGAASYHVDLGCQSSDIGDPATPATVAVSADCVSSGQVAVLGQALDAAGTAIAFSSALVAPPQAGATSNLTLPAWRSDFDHFTVTLAHLPAGARMAQTDLTLYHGSVRFAGGHLATALPTADGTATQVFAYSHELASQLLWKPTVLSSGGVQLLVASSASPLPAGDSFDLADALPAISMGAGTIAAGGSPELTWQAAGALDAADGMVAIGQWINPNMSRVRWTLFAPAGAATALDFPRLPDSLKSLRGVLGISVTPSIYVVESDQIQGYDDFRRGAGAALFETAAPMSNLRVRISATGTLGL